MWRDVLHNRRSVVAHSTVVHTARVGCKRRVSARFGVGGLGGAEREEKESSPLALLGDSRSNLAKQPSCGIRFVAVGTAMCVSRLTRGSVISAAGVGSYGRNERGTVL